LKKLVTWTFAISLVVSAVRHPHAQNPAPQLGKNTVKEVVAAMTTEEKAKLLVGMGLSDDSPDLPMSEEAKKLPAPPVARTRFRDSVFRHSLSPMDQQEFVSSPGETIPTRLTTQRDFQSRLCLLHRGTPIW
jgi:hypothetical protein